MLTTIKGYYEEGKITLQEQAPVVQKTPVIITFLAADLGPQSPEDDKPAYTLADLWGKLSDESAQKLHENTTAMRNEWHRDI